MNHIELFAGCGGLTLGLESEGFELLAANELSPMAAETFAYNILDVDLNEPDLQRMKVHWIKSQYPATKMNQRLRENPLIASDSGKESDLNFFLDHPNNLKGSLLVGSIIDLNQKLQSHPELAEAFKSGFSSVDLRKSESVDLVSGGPPCQSFSMAGLRQMKDPKNSLPWAFAEFVRVVNPKIALLENVSGILRAFNAGSKRYYAWFEVAKAFALEGYVPLCLHVNAKYAGAAQNRPRFIMLAFRKDVADMLIKSDMDQKIIECLENSNTFYKKVTTNGGEVKYGDLDYFDVEDDQAGIFSTSIFMPLVEYKSKKEFTVEDAINDLYGKSRKQKEYVKIINNNFGKFASSKKTNCIANTEDRQNNLRVKARFRLYQVISRISTTSRQREVSNFIKKADSTLLNQDEINELAKGISKQTVLEIMQPNNWLLTTEGKVFFPRNKNELITLLTSLHTKKQTQKALVPNRPAPAALSIPDDACHYAEPKMEGELTDGELKKLRTLTVREMARFQSFPDNFVFRSKVTTGGQMRKFEVPQYTQVGNAVPPMLGKALGKVCKSLLEVAKS